MNKNLLVFLFISFFLQLESNAQEQSLDYKTSNSNKKVIQSDFGRNYELTITLPLGYSPEKQYKVLYYLDGFWLNEVVKGAYRVNRLANKVDELILVGISSIGDEEDWNKQRNLDYTPSKYDIEKMKLTMDTDGVALNDSTTGQSEKFMKFFRQDVINTIESIYNIDTETRGILGHSFGGLFGFFAFMEHNDLFKNYILISPSIWWNKSELLTEENLAKNKKAANIFIVMGEDESKMLKKPIRTLLEKMTLLEMDKIQINLKEHQGLNHHSIISLGAYEGIEKLYSSKH